MRLEHGQKIGQHKIIEYIGTSVFGDVYSVIFGSTNRKYALHIIPSDSDVTVEALNEYIKKLRKLQSPCVVKCFASGETDGYKWLRTERPSGLKSQNLFTNINCQTEEEKNHKTIYDLDSLISASSTTGGLAGDDCSLILYDVLETVSNLHAYDLYVGCDFTNPFLDKLLSPVGVVARIPVVMWPENQVNSEAIAKDVVEAGRLIEKIVNAADPLNKNWSAAKLELLALAEKAKNLDGYDAACQLYIDVIEIFAKHGIKYFGRCTIDEFVPQTVGEQAVDASSDEAKSADDSLPQKSSHGKNVHSHKRKHKSAFSKQRRHSSKKHDTVNQQIIRNSKFVLMIVLLVMSCAGLAFFLQHHEEKMRISQSINADAEYSAITIIGEDADEALASKLPALIEDYSVEQLITYKSTNPLAAARYAIMLWYGLNGIEQNRAEARELVQKNKEYYDEQCKYDVEMDFWRAYLILSGVGYESRDEEALAILDKLANNGNPKAGLILGDYYAQLPNTEKEDNDSEAMRYWRMSVKADYGFKAESIRAMNRILYFVLEGRGMPKEKEYPVFFNAVERFASANHIPSQLVLARLNYTGTYLPQSFPNAVKWYRKIANNTQVHFVLRADAMVHLGDMFLKGEANQSTDAAYHWYERAAALGDGYAMNRLIKLYAGGVPREFANEEERIKAGDEAYWTQKVNGVDLIDIKGLSEPSYTVFNDLQRKSFKEPKAMPITVRIQYAGTRENPRTTEIKEIFNSIKVVKKKSTKQK